MKAKKFKKVTLLELPDNEKIIGGDAPKGSENKERKKKIKELVEKVENKLKNKKYD